MLWFKEILFIFINLFVPLYSVDRTNFKTCEDSSFCRRNRNWKPQKSPFIALLNTTIISFSDITLDIINIETNVLFTLEIRNYEDDILQIKMNEKHSVKPRFEVPFVILPLGLGRLNIQTESIEKLVLKLPKCQVMLYADPFQIDIVQEGIIIMQLNRDGRLNFEHFRQKNSETDANFSKGEKETYENMQNENEIFKSENENKPENENIQNENENIQSDNDEKSQELNSESDYLPKEEKESWVEHFKSHADSRIYGPSSVGLDIRFPGSQHVYGLPEHADHFSLVDTTDKDPYRLYNLDVFEYELYNTMALYGSVPFIISHNRKNSVGVLWLNAAETWVDINKGPKEGVLSSVYTLMSGEKAEPFVTSHWMSECGLIDMYVMIGPMPKDVTYQYSKLTGSTPLPPLFSLGYHQCRWNYKDEQEVAQVNEGFDTHDMPYDVLWLDIEYTDGKKYFTWDQHKFPNPTDMVQSLAAKGRYMVTILDPHIKRDQNYFVYNDAMNRGYFVKTKEGRDFEGWCWPGSSAYLDFMNPEVQQFWSSLLLPTVFPGSLSNLHVWNDMNEPSVFSGPEITMPKDNIHFGGWEHRDVHNIYGMLQHMSTFQGLIQRSNGHLRPFILTRAFYAGSQRTAAVWTGDNSANWDHLRMSIPMLLSLSVSGITFCGADVGGFFKDPDAELLTRWYQAGSFQPFFRAHAHIDTKRREPWLTDDLNKEIRRDVLRKRQILLPFWYTLFYETEKTGMPPMRPLWMEYPADEKTFNIDTEYLLGSSLLVHPVTAPGVHTVTVYFPGTNELWYDVDNYESVTGGQEKNIPVTIRKVPVFQRGGSIIPKRERVRRSSSLTKHDPFTLVVAPDIKGYASGSIYIDDYESYNYQKGIFLLSNFSFLDCKLHSEVLHYNQQLGTQAWIERIVIMGRLHPSKDAVLITSKQKTVLETLYDSTKQLLTIRKPAVSITETWTININ